MWMYIAGRCETADMLRDELFKIRLKKVLAALCCMSSLNFMTECMFSIYG